MQRPRIFGKISFSLFLWGMCVPAMAILDKMNIKRMFQANITEKYTGV